MAAEERSPKPEVDLRQRAEAQWQAQQSEQARYQSERDVLRLIQELQIHQIELEIQNEELSQARKDLEISHSHYLRLYDFAPVGYLTLDTYGIIHQANLTATTLLQIHRPQLLERRFHTFVAESHLPIFQEFIDQAFSQEDPVAQHLTCELRLTTSHHVPLYVQLEANLSLDGQTMQVAVIDISARKHSEEMLKASEMSFQVLVESAPIAIFIQTERRFAYANQACLALFGAQTKEQLLGQSVLERFHPDNREQVSARIDQLNEQHKAVNLAEETVVRFDNTTLDTYVSAVPFYFAGKSGALVFVEDITEKKLSTEHAFRLALEQKRLSVLVSFLRDTSHEFRTPLSIIQSDVYLLDRLTDSTKRQQKIEEINRQITNMTRLIELLTESALLDTNMPVDMVALNLNTLISNVVDNLRKRNPPDAERVTLVLAPALPLILVDTPRLSMALREIVDNAVRFTQPQGNITVRSALHVEGVMIEVQDDGIGIDPVVRQHLFEWFYRQDQAHTTPGLGLGLAFANAVVRSHGGRIEVESQEGVGSLFRMILPIQDTNVS